MGAAPSHVPVSTMTTAALSLLIEGGDHRQEIDPETGRTVYGAAVVAPRDVVPLGTATSSSLPADLFPLVLDVASQLDAADPMERERLLARVLDEVRDDLARTLRLPADTDVALTPSGTDAHYLALAVAFRPTDSVCSIVVGADESTLQAVSGRHYSPRVPRSDLRVATGAPVPGLGAERVRTVHIRLRDAEGRLRAEAEVDGEVAAAVSEAMVRGERPFLHAMAASATGHSAPSEGMLSALDAWFGDELVVLVNAAQGRFRRSELHSWLGRGRLVLITGSKFFGGPAFCGALLVPHRMWPGRHHPPPAGLGLYVSGPALPRSWWRWRQRLAGRPQAGLATRWVCALALMEAWYALPHDERDQEEEDFRDAAVSALDGSSLIRVVDDAAGIVSFTVRGATMERMSQLRRYLVEGPAYPAPWYAGFPTRFQLGQPIALGEDGPVVLSVALGAPLAIGLREASCSALSRLMRALSCRIEAVWAQLDDGRAQVVGR